MESRCPCCGSTRIAVDHQTGNLVCQECGCVIEEGLIDDYSPWRSSTREHPHRRRVLGRPLPSADTSSWGAMARIRLALAPGEEPPEHVRRIMARLPTIISARKRTRLALAYYIYERSEGNSKAGAVTVASKKTGLSRKALERILRRYRPWIEEEISRVAMEWKTLSGTRRA